MRFWQWELRESHSNPQQTLQRSFDTPSFTPAQSVSNGIPEPTGDTFALDPQHFEEKEDLHAGLGPVYNATWCTDCHQNPVTGGPCQITEIRVGHKGPEW